MAIDWKRFRFLCNVDDSENVWVYPTDNVAIDMGDMAVSLRQAQSRRLVPMHKLIPANTGHRPGIAVFFARPLKRTMLNIGTALDRIADEVLTDT